MNPTERFSFDQKTQNILEHLTIPFAIYQYIDKRVVTIALSQGFCDEFGFEKLQDAYRVMDGDMYRATHPDDKTRVADAAYRFAAFGTPYDIVYRTRTLKDSDYIILHAYGKSIYPEPGVRLCLTWYAYEGHYSPDEGTYESILSQTLSRFLTEESQYRGVYYDHMTGLPNMSYFYELAEAGRKRMRDHDVDSAIMFFDLTGFRQFNQRYGFAEGDRLINSIAGILARHFSSESCARFAQDHFAAFAPEEGLEQRLEAVIAECHAANDGKTLPIRIGIYPDRLEPVEIGTACDRARLAADARKKRDESCYSFFNMDMMIEEQNRQAIIDSLDTAIEEGWIQVHYQPIVRSTNGKVCNVEALARWNDPARGMLMPASFIPVLEDAALIPKLDLCVVRRVLDDLKRNEQDGFVSVPVSINFSRADFDAHDLVHEICSLVDEAGVDRKMINIEITESLVGSDFEYMKEQVERFRAQGFQVWMDDFGSGYSSLDVLQSVKFDLIKFDMGFMRRLDEGENGKIILTELMRMATSLGVDTICEGVETEQQARFLQEIGCSKLQGYYFMKPTSPEKIREAFAAGTMENLFEDSREAGYHDIVGRVNLYDLAFLANMDDNVVKSTFDTVPMGVMEISDEGDAVRYLRSNQTFRDFMKRAFSLDVSDPDKTFPVDASSHGLRVTNAVQQCRGNNNRAFVDDAMEDGSTAHCFVRKIGENPVNGNESFAIAALSVSAPDDGATYADIARSLAADYYNIYLIDLDTNDYIEYSSSVGDEEMSLERHGEDFFESARRDTMTRIYEEDRQPFLALFTKENVLADIERQGVFTTTYRLIDTGTPLYVNMKVTKMRGGNRLILGVSIIDAHMQQLQEEQNLRQEKASLERVAALSPDYIVLYTIDPETGHYTQYNPSSEFEEYGLAKTGEDFFADVVSDASKAIAPEDIERHLRVLTQENVIRTIRQDGFFTHNYRLLMGGKAVPVSLRATMVRVDGAERIILGVTNDEEEYRRKLEAAYKQASSNVLVYNHIAHALARDCADLFYVNMETNELIEFHTDDKRGVLSEARRGADFFEGCERDAKLYVHPDDQEAFVRAMNRTFLEEALSESKVFELIYRRIKEGRSFYAHMKVSRMEDDPNIIVIAVSDIDELMKQRRMEERIQEERIVYARLHAITGNFIVIYIVDPVTNSYREFSSTSDYAEQIGTEKAGTDFFNSVRRDAMIYAHPKDLESFLSAFTKENVLAEVEQNNIFTWDYRILMGDRPLHVQMKAAMVEEKEGPRLVVGLNDIDVQVRQQEENEKRLAQAQSLANIDGLTGVKNKHAYLEAEARMNRVIDDRRQPPFAIVIADVNDLKKVNDTSGHQAGDRHLREASRIICNVFKRSPVFRVGGDEFAIIVQGPDYEHIEERLEKVYKHNDEALETGGVVIACGMSRFQDDASVSEVYDRADRDMYENKNKLKGTATECEAAV